MIERSDFECNRGILSLYIDYVIENPDYTFDGETCERTHDNGWTIKGVVEENYYSWVNNFTAYHVEYGVITGNFNKSIKATSQRTIDQFLESFPLKDWSYEDI